jgi:hypothetical protein
VKLSLPLRNWLPTTLCCPPKRVCQRRWLITTRLGELAVSSSSISSRPAAGVAPSSRKKFPVTMVDSTCCGGPSPVSAKSRFTEEASAASSSSDARCRQSCNSP